MGHSRGGEELEELKALHYKVKWTFSIHSICCFIIDMVLFFLLIMNDGLMVDTEESADKKHEIDRTMYGRIRMHRTIL